MRYGRERSRETHTWWIPWAIVLGFALYASSGFWTATSAAFAGKLSSDNTASMWFYDAVSRSLGQGNWPQFMTDFNHPRPWPRGKEFPAVMDAVIAAPLGWMLDFPHQWNATLGLAVIVNALGTSLLAYGAGARGVGVIVAGCLGALCRPVWKDFVMARMNAVWIGLPAAALGLSLIAIRLPKPTLHGAVSRLPISIAAGLLGALAATVYPPYLLIFAPAAVALAISPLWESRGWSVIPLLAALGVGVGAAWPELSSILATRSNDLLGAGCPDMYGALTTESLWNTEPSNFQGLSLPGTALYGWVLAPLAILHRRRGAATLLFGITGLLALLSLGPCAASASGLRLHPETWPMVGSLLPSLWQAGAPLHDFGRFAAVAVVQAAVLGALGLHAIAGVRHRWRQGIAVALGTGVVLQVQWYVLSESIDPQKWHAIEEPIVAEHLREAGHSAYPAVEFPFDRKVQFLSAIFAPGPRLNPLRPGDPPPIEDPVVAWYMALGRGDLARAVPASSAIQQSHFQTIYLDPDRCRAAGVPRAACGTGVRSALTDALGEPERLERGVLVWRRGLARTDTDRQPPAERQDLTEKP